MINIDDLTPTEVNERIHIEVLKQVWDKSRCRVCGWPLSDEPTGCHLGDCSQRPVPAVRADATPNYCGDHTLARLVEDKLEEMGPEVYEEYAGNLVDLVVPGIIIYDQLEDAEIWKIIRATPEQKCRAALKAVQQ